jgi:hypothetical protein
MFVWSTVAAELTPSTFIPAVATGAAAATVVRLPGDVVLELADGAAVPASWVAAWAAGAEEAPRDLPALMPAKWRAERPRTRQRARPSSRSVDPTSYRDQAQTAGPAGWSSADGHPGDEADREPLATGPSATIALIAASPSRTLGRVTALRCRKSRPRGP